jgi:hypothetical protein
MLLIAALLVGATFRQALAQVAPVITTQPASQTVLAGTNANFSVVAAGTAPLAYQWLRGGTNIDSATNSTFTPLVSSLADAGSYTVRVSNAAGSVVSAAAVLTVNAPAVFTTTPVSQVLYLGQTANFSVAASGSAPVTFQWYFGTTTLTNATNASLTVGPVDYTNAGAYTIVATNAYGGQSTFAVLSVIALPAPAIRLDTARFSEGSAVFPVLYTGHGTETNLSFSLTFDPTVYTNVTFFPASTENVTWSTDTSKASTGSLGVSAVYAAVTFAVKPGENLIGNFGATVVSGATNRFAGRVGLTGVPLPLSFAPALVTTNSTNTAMLITNSTVQLLGPTPPVFTATASAPVLNPQTGLLEQPIELANPGNTVLEGTFVTVAGLGVDSRTNSILLANAQGYLSSGTAFVNSGTLAPGERHALRLEYYVPDRSTVPAPTLAAYGATITLADPPAGTALSVITNRFIPQGFLVEFATRSDRRYYVQYADRASDFTGTNAAAIFTALPAVPGTGASVQWLDNGPPKTRSIPTAGARFYRVLETK